MSVTIAINNNHAFCQKHILVEIETIDDEKFEMLPYQLNIANDNFQTLWSALGFEVEWCGEMNAMDLFKAIVKIGPDLIVRETRESSKPEHTLGLVSEAIVCGIKPMQARRYLDALAIICGEALRRNEKIVWC